MSLSQKLSLAQRIALINNEFVTEYYGRNHYYFNMLVYGRRIPYSLVHISLRMAISQMHAEFLYNLESILDLNGLDAEAKSNIISSLKLDFDNCLTDSITLCTNKFFSRSQTNAPKCSLKSPGLTLLNVLVSVKECFTDTFGVSIYDQTVIYIDAYTKESQ